MARCSSSGCFNILKLFRPKENEVSEVSTCKTVGNQFGAPHTISCDFTVCYKIHLYFNNGGHISDCVCSFTFLFITFNQ